MVPNPMGLYRARVAVSDASTLRTSDWDNPNCRAIKDGLMPALNAARTALICPRGNETVATSCRLWSVRDDRFGTDSSNSPLGGDLLRLFDTRRNQQVQFLISEMVHCVGQVRSCADVAVAGGDGSPSGDAVENRSGVTYG